MRAFSQLLDDLVYTRSRNTKLKLIGDYLKETPDPDRGYGLAALTGTLDIPAVKARLTTLGVEPMPLSQQDFAKFIRDDIEANVALVKSAKIPTQ